MDILYSFHPGTLCQRRMTGLGIWRLLRKIIKINILELFSKADFVQRNGKISFSVMFWEGDNNDGTWTYLIENKVRISCKLSTRTDMWFTSALFLITFNYVKFSEVASLLPGDIMVHRIVLHSLSELTNAAHNMRNALINIWKTRV